MRFLPILQVRLQRTPIHTAAVFWHRWPSFDPVGRGERWLTRTARETVGLRAQCPGRQGREVEPARSWVGGSKQKRMDVIPDQRWLSPCPTDHLVSPERDWSKRLSAHRQPTASGQRGMEKKRDGKEPSLALQALEVWFKKWRFEPADVEGSFWI